MEEKKPSEGQEQSAAPEQKEVQSQQPLQQALEDAKSQAERYLANWQRAQADLENFKRRVNQEREELVKFVNLALISHLLPVLDDLERALGSADSILRGLTWVDGIRLVHRKFLAALEAHGVTEIKALGEEFDPRLHQAVLFGDGPQGKVIAELQKGYILQDRVVRPALVSVGRQEPTVAVEGDSSMGPEEQARAGEGSQAP